LYTAENVRKDFGSNVESVKVLENINLYIRDGEFLVIFGPSGCGKSTLLHILLGLEAPTSGKVFFKGNDIYKNMDEDSRTIYRKTNIGMVYQQSNWIKSLNVRDNVMFPLRLSGTDGGGFEKRVTEVLSWVGMQDRQENFPSELSSGQQQKISLARAVISNPSIIVADEPTGNLDFDSGNELMELLKKLNGEDKTVIMVTHDLEYLKYATRAIRMFNGKIEEVIDDPVTYHKHSSVKFKR